MSHWLVKSISGLHDPVTKKLTGILDYFNNEIMFNQSALDPEGTSNIGGFLKIAVLGDSMSAQNHAFGPAWPHYFQETLRNNGINCETRAFAVNGATFYSINNTAIYSGKTQIQACIDYDPHIVLLVVGVNDTVNAPLRTLVQVKADADYTISTLRRSLPYSQIWYGEQQPYDSTNFTSSTVKNKGLPPLLMAKKATGILTGAYTPAILDDAASSTTKSELANYDAFMTYIKAKTELTGSFAMRAWKLARLGLLINDGYHFNRLGDILKASAAITTLRAAGASFLAGISDQNVTGWSNVDTMISGFLTPSGDGYTPTWPTTYSGSGPLTNMQSYLKMDSWMYEYKATCNFYPLSLTNNLLITAQYNWYIRNAQPYASVQNALLDHGTQATILPFTATGKTTDQDGNAEDRGLIGALGLPSGTYDFYLKAGNDAFGPFVITLT